MDEKDEIIIEEAKREYCLGCGLRKRTLQSVFLPYATSLIYLCQSCSNKLAEKLKETIK